MSVNKPVFIDKSTGQYKEHRSGDTFENKPDVSFDTISDMMDYDIGNSPITKSALVLGFSSANDQGGGIFRWNSNEDKANHNGGTVINPDHNSTIGSTNWYSASGDSTDTTGSGCWVRIFGHVVHLSWFGIEESDDEKVKIEAAIAAAENKILDLDGYDLETTGEIIIEHDIKIIGNEAKVTGDSTGYIIRARGSRDNGDSLDKKAKVGDGFIVCSAAASKLSRGDLFSIESDKKFNPNIPAGDQGADNTAGEMHVVHYVDGSTIYLREKLFYTYPSLDESSTDTTVHKINPINFHIEGVELEQLLDNSSASGIILNYGIDSYMEVKVPKAYGVAIRVNNSYNTEVHGFTGEGDQDGAGYGISVNGMCMFTDIYGEYLHCRHATNIGASGGQGVPWETTYHGIVGSIAMDEFNHSIFDTHAACGTIYYNNCVGHGINPKAAENIDAWDSGVTYNTGDEVYKGEVYYSSKTDNNSGNDPDTDRDNWWPQEQGSVSLFSFRAGDITINDCKGYDCQTGINFGQNKDFPNVDINGLSLIRKVTTGIDFKINCTIENLSVNNFKVKNRRYYGPSPAFFNVHDGGAVTINSLDVANINIQNMRLVNIREDINGIDSLVFSNIKTVNEDYPRDVLCDLRAPSINEFIIKGLTSDSFGSGVQVLDTDIDIVSITDFNLKNFSTRVFAIYQNAEHLILNSGVIDKGSGNNYPLVYLDGTTYKKLDLIGVTSLQSPSITGVVELTSGTLKYLTNIGNMFGEGSDLLYVSGSNEANIELLSGDLRGQGVFRGTGDPGNLTEAEADIGSLFQRKDGGAGTSIYVKEADNGANTGWVAK